MCIEWFQRPLVFSSPNGKEEENNKKSHVILAIEHGEDLIE